MFNLREVKSVPKTVPGSVRKMAQIFRLFIFFSFLKRSLLLPNGRHYCTNELSVLFISI